MSKIDKARQVIEDHPGMPSREVAALAGVSHMTVLRARRMKDVTDVPDAPAPDGWALCGVNVAALQQRTVGHSTGKRPAPSEPGETCAPPIYQTVIRAMLDATQLGFVPTDEEVKAVREAVGRAEQLAGIDAAPGLAPGVYSVDHTGVPVPLPPGVHGVRDDGRLYDELAFDADDEAVVRVAGTKYVVQRQAIKARPRRSTQVRG